MKLYYFQVAPNPTRVRIYLREKGIGLEEELVDLREGEQRGAAHLARDPFGKLPVLELDDGEFLTESQAIIEYLEELHPAPCMIGKTPIERARARSLDRIADLGGLIATARAVHATNSPLGVPPVPEVAKKALEARATTLRVLDEWLADSVFLGGERPSTADCTLYAGLNFGRVFGIEIEPDYPRVVAWFESFGQRDSVTSL